MVDIISKSEDGAVKSSTMSVAKAGLGAQTARSGLHVLSAVVVSAALMANKSDENNKPVLNFIIAIL